MRRDLIQLSKDGLVERGHGGAAPRRPRRFQGLPELPVLERAGLRVSEKRSIGREAARYVEDGDVILINDGTTTAQMVPFLGAARDVTVITNGLNIASSCEEQGVEVEVVSTESSGKVSTGGPAGSGRR